MTRRKKTLLLIEDEPTSRRLLARALREMGFTVIEEANGRSALERLKESIPELVCLQLALPDISGYEICEFMKRTQPLRRVPILAMSNRPLPLDRALAEEAGVTSYLLKPFPRSEFVRQIMALVPPTAELTPVLA